MVAAPEWDFAANPVKAITYATGLAADARNGRDTRPVDIPTAKFWTEVSLALSAAAGLEPGAVARGLAAEFRIQ